MNNRKQNKLRTAMAILAGGMVLFFIGRSVFVQGDTASFLNQSPSGENQRAIVQPSFSTCEICGYQSISPNTLLCPICYVELTEAERILWEYASLEEMIAEEQANFFAAEGFRDSGLFFIPENWVIDGARYPKDTLWQPVIDRQTVVLLRDTLLQRGIIE